MTDFGHLKKLDVKDKTARYSIFQIEGEPALILKPANEANKPYFNAVLKRSRRNVKAIQAGAVNQAMISENRAQDRELFPRFVVVGWEGVTDSKGKEVEFSRDNCSDFLRALPDWIFDEVRNYASNSANFADDFPVDAEAKAGN